MSEPLPWSVIHETNAGIRLIDRAGNLCGTLVGTDDDGPTDTVVQVGRLRNGWTGSVTLFDGRSFQVCNGRSGGLRRADRTVTVDFDGRRWICRHTTDRRAVITRDGHQIARLHRTWRWWKPGTAAGVVARADYTFTECTPQLEYLDELMITVFAVVLGPPGREGAIGRVGHGIASVASIFT